ncbi:hypothetical protein BH09MYX1_BH09MYX1_37550 [soil metagenome]
MPTAGSCTSSPGCGFVSATIASMSGRGVKYCPAPLFVSSAFFSSKPSYRSPRPSDLALYQSSASIDSTTMRKFRGCRNDVLAFAKIACTRPEPSAPRLIKSVL